MNLAAFGFWMFIAIVSAAGIWGQARKRDTEHETLRRLLESGKDIDENTLDKLMSASTNSEELSRDLKVGGLITGFIAPGLFVFGWIMSKAVKPEMFAIMGAVALLMISISLGLMVASWSVGNRHERRFGHRSESHEI
jgi:hypothetical protein